MSVRPDLSVIVVTHNRAELAIATLRSARHAARGLDVQWLIVDSGSSDGTPEAIERELPDMRVLRWHNAGFAAANNHALPLAHGRYVLLLNPDVEIARGDFAELLAALDARPRVGVASVIQEGSDAELQHSIRRYPSARAALGEALGLRLPGWSEEVRRPSNYEVEHAADWLVGAFLIARGEAVREVGALDERFFLYSEETDWCYRARAAGWEVRHLPQMTITHHTTPSTRPDLVAQLSWSKLLFARKHYRRGTAAAIRVALAVRHLLRVVALVLRPRGRRERLPAERHALAVVLGVAAPPFPTQPDSR
jgi:N-acetylglucosaminyl-diphospho-decaprenol L-rhamnosyltransferase